MSAPVDALAVMLATESALVKAADGSPDALAQAARSCDARAAIAEQQEILRRLVACNHNVNGGGEELGEICRDAETVLRACGGDK